MELGCNDIDDRHCLVLRLRKSIGVSRKNSFFQVLEGGEIALAGFTLKDGVNKFLSAHILPSNETLLENSKEQLRLPTSQQCEFLFARYLAN